MSQRCRYHPELNCLPANKDNFIRCAECGFGRDKTIADRVAVEISDYACNRDDYSLQKVSQTIVDLVREDALNQLIDRLSTLRTEYIMQVGGIKTQ